MPNDEQNYAATQPAPAGPYAQQTDGLTEEQLEELQRKRDERRKRNQKRRLRKKRRQIVLIVVLALVVALGACYYFFLGDMVKGFMVNYHIDRLSDMTKYESVEDYSAAVADARAKYDALTPEAQLDIDAYPLEAAETLSGQLTALASSIASLSQGVMSVADYPAAAQAAASARAEVDLLNDAEKALVNADALTASEAALAQFRTDNDAVITLNEDIAAFTLSEGTDSAAISADIAAYQALANRVDSVGSPDADAAALLAKKAEIDAKIVALYTQIGGELTTLSGYISTMQTEMDAIDAAIAAGKTSGSSTTFETATMTASMDRITAALENASAFMSSSSCAAMVAADSGTFTASATDVKTKYTEAFNYMTGNTINSTKKLDELKALFETAKTALQASMSELSAYNESVTAALNAYVAFTDGDVQATLDAPQQTAEGEAATGEPGYLTGDDINLRSGAGTDFDSLGKFNKNTVLTILGESGDWYNVQIGDKVGYVRKDLVAKGTPAA